MCYLLRSCFRYYLQTDGKENVRYQWLMTYYYKIKRQSSSRGLENENKNIETSVEDNSILNFVVSKRINKKLRQQFEMSLVLEI